MLCEAVAPVTECHQACWRIPPCGEGGFLRLKNTLKLRRPKVRVDLFVCLLIASV